LCLLFDKVTKHQSTCKEVFYTAVFYYRTAKRKKDAWFLFASIMNHVNPNFAGLNNLFSQWVAAQAPGSTTQGHALGQSHPNLNPQTPQTSQSPNPPPASSNSSPTKAGTQLNQLGNKFFQFLNAQQASPTDSSASTSATPTHNPNPSPQPAGTNSHAEMFNAFQSGFNPALAPTIRALLSLFPLLRPQLLNMLLLPSILRTCKPGARRLLSKTSGTHFKEAEWTPIKQVGKGGKGGSSDQIICRGCGGPHGWQSCPNLAQNEDTVFSHIIVTEQARYEREQNRARINAKILAAGLDPVAFGFNRRSNGQSYASPANVMAQLSGVSAATPNYGAPPPFPAPGTSPPMGHAPAAHAGSPMPNTAEMFQRFQEFMYGPGNSGQPTSAPFEWYRVRRNRDECFWTPTNPY
jgi:hypothetical protein